MIQIAGFQESRAHAGFHAVAAERNSRCSREAEVVLRVASVLAGEEQGTAGRGGGAFVCRPTGTSSTCAHGRWRDAAQGTEGGGEVGATLGTAADGGGGA
jgi:hypothetical protein